MKLYIVSIVLGIFVTFFGFFAGLQISPAIGTILVFPFVIAVQLSGIGFGNFPTIAQVGLVALTISFWASLFIFGYKLITRRSQI